MAFLLVSVSNRQTICQGGVPPKKKKATHLPIGRLDPRYQHYRSSHGFRLEDYHAAAANWIVLTAGGGREWVRHVKHIYEIG